MFKFRKLALVTALLITILSIFAGCGQTENPTTTAPGTTTTTSPTTTTTTTTQDPTPSFVALTQAWRGDYNTPYIDSIVLSSDKEIRLYYDESLHRYTIVSWEYKSTDQINMYYIESDSEWSFDGLKNGSPLIKATNVRHLLTDEVSDMQLLYYKDNQCYKLGHDEHTEIVSGDVKFRTSTCKFDIDGDGKEEYCVIEPLKEYPYDFFKFIVFENETTMIPEYFDVFCYDMMYSTSFAVVDGKLTLFSERLGYAPTQEYWDVRVENGRIRVSENGVDMRSYVDEPPGSDFETGPIFAAVNCYYPEQTVTYFDIDNDGVKEKFFFGWYYDLPTGNESAQIKWNFWIDDDANYYYNSFTFFDYPIFEATEVVVENGELFIKATIDGVQKTIGKVYFKNTANVRYDIERYQYQ